MAGTAYVYAGAAASLGGTLGGVFRQAVGEDRWERLADGLPNGTEVHAVTLDPQHPETVYIGTTTGAWRSGDRGRRWERMNLPGQPDIWSILVHPGNPRRLYAGASPIAVFRSDDGGERWRALADPALPNRVHMAFACRVMRLDLNPDRPDEVYATMEANGAMRSQNAGESWEDCTEDLIRFCEEPRYRSRIGSQTEIEGMLDGHALACSAAAPGTVFLANRMGLFRSSDRGEHWQDIQIGRFSPLTYGRDIRVALHDPRVMYACLSPAARSTDGSIWRSDDIGESWRRFDHGIKPEATMMAVALNPHDPGQVFGVSRVGQVFGTTDGGKSWRETRLPDGVRDVYALACG